MTDQSEHIDPSIFSGAKRVMQGVPKVAAAIVGLSGFAYIVGWAYARAYFQVFGASWLRSEVPLLTLLGYSWWPVIILIFFAYLGITDLAETENKENKLNSTRLKRSRYILNYGRWVFAIVIIIDISAGAYDYVAVARVFSLISVFVVFAMATSAIEILAFRLSRPSIESQLHIAQLTYVIIAFGLYFAPTQMGHNAALEDINNDSFNLPTVVLRDDSTDFRLLLSSGDRLYIIPAKYETKYPPIKIVNINSINSIQKVTKK